MVAAECVRLFSPAKYRGEAQECGSRLVSEFGAVDPYPLFMHLVDGTTGVTHRGAAEDITSHRTSAFRPEMAEVTDGFGNVLFEYSVPARILLLSNEDLRKFDVFLFKQSLEDIASQHGLN